MSMSCMSWKKISMHSTPYRSMDTSVFSADSSQSGRRFEKKNPHGHLVLWLRHVIGVILLWRPAQDCQKLQISQLTRWLHSCLILTIRISWDKIPCRCLSGSWRFEERPTIQGPRGHQWTDHKPAESFTLFSRPRNKSYRITSLGKLLGFQEVETPRISIQSAH